MKANWKAISGIILSLAVLSLSVGNSADGASTSVASQISVLQKKVATLRASLNTLESTSASAANDAGQLQNQVNELVGSTATFESTVSTFATATANAFDSLKARTTAVENSVSNFSATTATTFASLKPIVDMLAGYKPSRIAYVTIDATGACGDNAIDVTPISSSPGLKLCTMRVIGNPYVK